MDAVGAADDQVQVAIEVDVEHRNGGDVGEGHRIGRHPPIGLHPKDDDRLFARADQYVVSPISVEVGHGDGHGVDGEGRGGGDFVGHTGRVELALPLLAAAPSPREPPPASPLLVTAFGMQLHAAVTTGGRGRCRLERLCRYLLRPPFAQDAVQRTPDGQVRVHFEKPTRAGATYAQMSPDTFLARLCALVPPPGAHTVRYYGVLAGHHARRSRNIPRPQEQEPPPPKQLTLFVPHGPLELPAIARLLESQLRSVAPRRLSWMTLLARVFRIDISVCSRCSGPMRVTRAVITP